MTDDLPRQKLDELLNRFGRDVLDDPQRCTAVLIDLLGNGYKRERRILTESIQQRVPQTLLAPTAGLPLDAVLARLADKLHNDLGFDHQLSAWVVQTWCEVLNVRSGNSSAHAVSRPAVPRPNPRNKPTSVLAAKVRQSKQARQQADAAHQQARQLIKQHSDYAQAAGILKDIDDDLRDNVFYAQTCQQRDWLVTQRKQIETQVHAEQFDWLAPVVQQYLAVAPHDAEMQELLAELDPPPLPADWKNQTRTRFKLILPGEFTMGDDWSDQSDEKPAHRVRITRPFYCGISPVTQAEYQSVMGSNPSHFKGSDRPVEKVSWEEAAVFCRRLNVHGRDALGDGWVYRLLSEAEWEYCCRAGTTTRWCCDSDQQLGDYAWYSANAGSQTHPVGQKLPNAWGLYDMHGNVLEWCLDWLDSAAYKSRSRSVTDDPVNLTAASDRVIRGGSWDFVASNCHSACRNSFTPDYRDYDLGFRLSRGPELK